MKQTRQHIPALVILLIFTLYQLLMVINRPNPATSLLFWDTVGYSTALIQFNDAEALSRDTVFGSHLFSDSMWISSLMYMSGLNLTYHVTGEDIEATMRYFRILLIALYLPVMYFFLVSVNTDRLFAVIISIVSSFPSYYTITNIHWGIPAPALNYYTLVPQVLYSIELPIVAMLAYRYWFKPGFEGTPIRFRNILGIGCFVGIGLYVFHAISSLGLIEFISIISILQALRRKIPWWTIPTFLLGVLPFLMFRVFIGSGSVSVSPEGAELVMDIGRPFMIFPWEAGNIRLFYKHFASEFNSTEQFIHAFYAAYWIITIIGLWLMRGKSRVGAILFVIGQLCLALIHTYTGALLWFLGIYGFKRIMSEEADELDFALVSLMSLSILLGTFQQMLGFYFWETLRIDSLISIIYEMARFQHIFHLPFYLLLARAIWSLTQSISLQWVRIAIIGFLGYLTILNQVEIAVPFNTFTLAQAVLITMGLMLAIYPSSSGESLSSVEHPFQRQVKPSTLYAALTGAIVFYLLFSAPFKAPPGVVPKEKSYLEMTAWVKNNTPRDSLFHLSDLEANFRFFAERSILLGYTDVTLGIYSGSDPEELASLQQIANAFQLEPSEQNTRALAQVLDAYDVNYVVTKNISISDTVDLAGASYHFTPVYSNSTYTVYRFQAQ